MESWFLIRIDKFYIEAATLQVTDHGIGISEEDQEESLSIA